MNEWKVTGVVRTIYRPTQEDDSAVGRPKAVCGSDVQREQVRKCVLCGEAAAATDRQRPSQVLVRECRKN